MPLLSRHNSTQTSQITQSKESLCTCLDNQYKRGQKTNSHSEIRLQSLGSCVILTPDHNTWIYRALSWAWCFPNKNTIWHHCSVLYTSRRGHVCCQDRIIACSDLSAMNSFSPRCYRELQYEASAKGWEKEVEQSDSDEWLVQTTAVSLTATSALDILEAHGSVKCRLHWNSCCSQHWSLI